MTEPMRTTGDTPIVEPESSSAADPGARKIRDELFGLLDHYRPNWTASPIDGEDAIGIETDDGEYFISVESA